LLGSGSPERLIPARVIERKRNGAVLEAQEMRSFFLRYLEGDVQEQQMAAFLMAVYFQGLAPEELDALVDVMLESGERLDLSGLPRPAVDKHSTGGVGDKVSLALAPLAGELGLSVPMIAGRGLGHTGGTLDKLSAIPGFRTDLEVPDFVRIVNRVGCGIIGQTAKIAPLDRRLYALRDVTGTVSSIPLIAASIMSKKLAEDLVGLVLDVKVGEGAFIADEPGATELARTLVGIGERRGVRTKALMTAMDRPLGRTVGNALEVSEALECLRGGGPPDLRELVLRLAAEMLLVGGVETNVKGALESAVRALDSGRALDRFRRLVEAQGGDPAVVDDPGLLPRAPRTAELRSQGAGVVRECTPTRLGYGLTELGGGRSRLGDSIDVSVGFVLHVEVGQPVARGESLGTVHAANDAGLAVGLEVLGRAISVGGADEPPPRLRPLITELTEPYV